MTKACQLNFVIDFNDIDPSSRSLNGGSAIPEPVELYHEALQISLNIFEVSLQVLHHHHRRFKPGVLI